MNARLRKLLVVVCLTLIVIGEWIMWEAVVKPLKDANPGAWDRGFPSPFYVFYAPLWFWHDLSITLVIVSAVILAYLALRGNNICRSSAQT
jgi:hypothetical protein